jgi:mitochondrial distribution and morphology protein 12
MSVDIAWDTFTKGEDGAALADQIRAFIHDKFQQVDLPRFIKSVHVHSFAFGSACPEIEIKDISNPLPDFYEDDTKDDSDPGRDSEGSTGDPNSDPAGHPSRMSMPTAFPDRAIQRTNSGLRDHSSHLKNRDGRFSAEEAVRAPVHPDTPGIPGGTSNFSYFHHLPMGGLSGTQTPLAAVASGTPFSTANWHHEPPHLGTNWSRNSMTPSLRETENFAPLSAEARQGSTRPSTANTLVTNIDLEPSLPSSPERSIVDYKQSEKVSDDPTANAHPLESPEPGMQQAQPSDMQVVAHVKYSGDVHMTLTAEILLDYPMPSFVGIPLKLSITGMAFDGVAILAYIRKRIHYCFLDPEDADTLVGDHVTGASDQVTSHKDKYDVIKKGLLKEIHVESEIGRQDGGKQILKNVGKVENFILEQIRKIFEDEFVFPSFWTFLV